MTFPFRQRSQSRLYHEVWRDSESWNDSTKFRAVDQRKLRWSLHVCVCVCVIPACRGFRANLCAPVPLTTLGPWRGSVNGNVSSKLACGREKERAARLFSSGNFQYLACLFIRPGKWKTEISVFPRGNSRVADNVSPTQSIRYAFHDVLETVNHECSIKWYEKWIYKSRTNSMWN